MTGPGSTAMGSGTLPANKGASVLFRSDDETVQFIVIVGNDYSFVNGSVVHFTVFRGDTGINPVLFAIVNGNRAYAAGDRFYYEYVAPAASYTMNLPMEIPWESLGYGNGAANQVTA